MERARFSIAKLMAVIVVIALDLALGRFVRDYNPWLAIGFLPACLALQLAAWRLIRTRGRSRAFWAGVIVAGGLAALSFAWGFVFSRSVGIGYNSTTGQIEGVSVPGRLGGDEVLALWSEYGEIAESCLKCVPYASDLVGRDWPDPGFQATVMVIVLVPQLTIALAGGLLALGAVRLKTLFQRGSDRPLLAQVP